ncbi:hypothetical protein C8Q70DRAFT_883543, partial [Cubamyces menziesii]
PYDILKFRIITQDVIDVIRADIQNTILPSWMERPPKNFGSASHGKLKADQWRTVCTVSLTITLVRLWGLRDIFSHELVPNHHLSLHLVSCLLLFGPVHGWWAYPFERYNGLLDDIPLTFMRGFYSGVELRWLMDSTIWPEFAAYKDMLSAYGAAFRDATRGTRVSDVL